jgi:glycosyltransferase involved in cell wall biosynthesis
MNVVLTSETRFILDSYGNVVTNNEHGAGYNYFKKYLDAFDRVIVVGRLQNENIPDIKQAMSPVTGEGVFFVSLPYYHGPTQYLKKSIEIKKKVRSVFLKQKMNSSFIARTPGKIGSLFIDEFNKSKFPYGMEVVSDPYDVFGPGAIRHPLRPIFRIMFTNKLKYQCSRACAVSYVTEFALQKRYPPSVGAFSTHYSSIQMKQGAYIEKPRNFNKKEKYNLIFVGTLDQLYKAPDILIDSVVLCGALGVELHLNIIGDGKFRPGLEQRVASKGLEGRIRFLGRLPSGEAIREQLDKADLFVLPSRGEGLPRAMIEAMARGLPCIGSTASGIPELLDADDLVPPDDVDSLGKKIRDILSDPDRMAQMSIRNLEKSKGYRSELLQKRRVEFYKNVKERTEKFMNIKGTNK